MFLFVGDGPRKAEVQHACDSEGIASIRLLDAVPREWLHASLSLADVHLISMKPQMNGIVVPGKLYGAMAAGRPIIFVGPEHCEPADTIRQAGCGFTLPPGDVPALVQAISMLAADQSLARRMGERARTAFIAHYEQRLCCNRWCELLDQILLPPGAPDPPAGPAGRSSRIGLPANRPGICRPRACSSPSPPLSIA